MIPEVQPDPHDLDYWLGEPAVRVAHGRESSASREQLWQAALQVHLGDTHVLGRLVRWRIPDLPSNCSFYELFTQQPFLPLSESSGSLLSGLVGRIWTLRRDYPCLDNGEQFREWSTHGTAKVLFAHWVEDARDGRSALRSETRVQAFGAQGRIGLASVRPLIAGFQHLVASDAIAAAVREAEQR